MLEKHAKSQAEVMAAFDERQRKLDQDLRGIVARLEERKRSDATSPRGGRRFEDQVCLFTHNALAGAPVFIEDTGAKVGARPGCKVGDQVIAFNSESIYAGATVVIEAKRETGCTMEKRSRSSRPRGATAWRRPACSSWRGATRRRAFPGSPGAATTWSSSGTRTTR